MKWMILQNILSIFFVQEIKKCLNLQPQTTVTSFP